MRINLLPPEIYERQRVRRRTAAVVVVGLIVLAALGAFYFLQILRLNEVEDDVTAQEAENAQLQVQINQLQEIDALQQEIETTRTLLNSLLADRVLWSGVLRDVSLVIPGQAWLAGLNGQVGAPATAGTTTTTTTTGTTTPGQVAQPGALVGQISFDGFAFTHRDVALWLSRLEDVRGFVNPWLSNSAKTDIGTQEAVQFTSSVDLSEQALARRSGGGQGGDGQ
ncbi:MAG: PilN domain-containing protein [Actinomycetota bacterium]